MLQSGFDDVEQIQSSHANCLEPPDYLFSFKDAGLLVVRTKSARVTFTMQEEEDQTTKDDRLLDYAGNDRLDSLF